MTVCSFSSCMLFPRFLLSSHRQTVHFTPVIRVFAVFRISQTAHFQNCRFCLLQSRSHLQNCLNERLCCCFNLDFRFCGFSFFATFGFTVALSAVASTMLEISFSVFPIARNLSIMPFKIPILSQPSFSLT